MAKAHLHVEVDSDLYRRFKTLLPYRGQIRMVIELFIKNFNNLYDPSASLEANISKATHTTHQNLNVGDPNE